MFKYKMSYDNSIMFAYHVQGSIDYLFWEVSPIASKAKAKAKERD